MARMNDVTVARGDSRRLFQTIEEFAAMTEGSGEGVTRLAYTPLERKAHARFAEVMEQLGCTVTVDPAGNSIATRPGKYDLPAIGTGSHLDSVYEGGRF